VTTYLVTLRDRETQTVVGYYNGAWTTDQRRALNLRKREKAEAHAARMRDLVRGARPRWRFLKTSPIHSRYGMAVHGFLLLC
jgi:hypothetical protein